MDIIIPIGVESRWQDNELRYALRSIEKYLTGYKDIYLIGNKRKWLTEVKYIPSGEVYTQKQKSIFQKILKAAKDENVSEKFIMWHDDHFLIKPLNVNEIKYWYQKTLDVLQTFSQGTYKGAVINTNKYLKEKSYSNFHFDIHVPIVFEKSKFSELETVNWGRDHVIKSLYCNKFAVEKEELKDINFGKPFTREEIRKVIEGRLFFSFNEHAGNDSMKDVLKELYPEQSKYERKVLELVKLHDK